MDVKSAFLYGKIEKEVYVCQPPGFEDPDFPDNVYKVEKALYRLHQALIAYPLSLSMREMHKKFQMSSMGELTFFLGLQVKQKEDGIFIIKTNSSFDLVAYTDSDYAGAILDRKSTTGGCQFLGCRFISWQCKKQTVVAYSITEAEYATVKVKTVNGEQQLQALVDGKKIIITEATVRRDLQLEDVDGVDCLPNTIIFEQLTLMATNQKFNFSKYIFESMVKNLDNAVKFLMYPRFVQVFLNNQLEGMATHNRIYIAPSHTKKIFANLRRQGKDFSGRVTPLFPSMVVQAQEEMGEGSAMPTDPHYTPIITQPSSSQPQRKQTSRRPKEKDTKIPQFSVPSDPTNVADEAVNEEPISSEEANLSDQEDASKQGRKIHDIDADEDITLENVDVNDLDGDEVVVESTEMKESSKKAEVIKESSSKRAGDELQQESTKKKKKDDDQERAELQSLMNLMEVQGGTQPLFRCLEALTGKIWKLCGNWLKLSKEDAVWRNLRESKVLVWKLFDSCDSICEFKISMSLMLKCLSDESLIIPMKELRLDDKLNFVEEPVEIMDREVKQLKQSHIPIVKVRWNSKRGPEFTWEREDQIRAKEVSDEDSSRSIVKTKSMLWRKGIQEILQETRKILSRQTSRRIFKAPKKPYDQKVLLEEMGAMEEDEVEQDKDETSLVAQALDEICLGINLEPDE
ncbi:putative ribonuclease H-like domain-containing protein [Tanacetum coccineum]